MGPFVILGLVLLVLVALIYSYAGSVVDTVLRSDTVESVTQVTEPTGTEAPEILSEESATEEADEEVEPELPAPAGEGQDDTAEPDELPFAQTAPSDSAMSLTIPKLGINNALVLDDVSEEGGLMMGAGHMPGTGFPWIEGSNTYIAGHRLGYPGTPSDHIFFDLHSMGPGDEITLEDALGQTYTYQVSTVMEVPPTDLSVTEPTGDDSISLQVCIEDYGDYATLGPNWNVRLIVRGERIA